MSGTHEQSCSRRSRNALPLPRTALYAPYRPALILGLATCCPDNVARSAGSLRRTVPNRIPAGEGHLLSRCVAATSSAGVADSRSGPRNLAERWKLPSLLRTIPRSTRAAHGRKSASRCGFERYSARFSISIPRTRKHIADGAAAGGPALPNKEIAGYARYRHSVGYSRYDKPGRDDQQEQTVDRSNHKRLGPQQLQLDGSAAHLTRAPRDRVSMATRHQSFPLGRAQPPQSKAPMKVR
jgi:hypothetical protein